MRVPIAYGLSWPERVQSGASPLDFSSLAALTFEPPNAQRFPGLQLAWESLRGPSGTTAVLNAANEVGVDAFLNRRIRFDQIHELNIRVLERCAPGRISSEIDLLDTDANARRVARAALAEISL
jgi:1-deoxy-D-xylulose-5-phosphate reductoisomerase